jgi:hypothetical protein
MEYEELLDRTLSHIRKMLLQKHHDYGTQNLLTFGEAGCVVRASDKLARLHHLVNGGEQKVENETHIDTWMDLAGYAVQAIILFCQPPPTDADLANDLFNDICPACKKNVRASDRGFTCECGAHAEITDQDIIHNRTKYVAMIKVWRLTCAA